MSWLRDDDLFADEFEGGEIMSFPLIFRGRLLSAQATKWTLNDTHEIRRQLHPQIRNQMRQMRGVSTIAKLVEEHIGYLHDKTTTQISWTTHQVGNLYFFPLVITAIQVNLVAELDIQLYWRERAGNIIQRRSGPDGIDIDNRIKHLLDALTMPQDNQVAGIMPNPAEKVLFCLLEDDKLVTRLAVTTARLPIAKTENEKPEYIEATINVTIRRADGLTESDL